MARTRNVLGWSASLALCTGLLAAATVAHAQVPVSIESTPAGATVYLNSTAGQPLGVTPLRNVRVPRGGATLVFRLDGYAEGQLPVNISRRREVFRIVLAALGTVVISSTNDATQGAAVRIDGQPVGNVPYRSTIQPGRHMVQVGREGYVTFSQWVELAGGQVLTLPVGLEAERPSTGSILVAGDVSGATVLIDGETRGTTPTVIENVTVGSHLIEIRAPGLPPHQETVQIVAGQRAALNPSLRPAQTGGSLRVIANAPGAMISLDGETLGAAPATRENVAAGEHIVEATAEGYADLQQPVTITTGQQRVVSLQLVRVQAAPGRIVVNANVQGATVTIDGQDRGRAPVIVESAAPGAHAIVVQAQGYEDHSQTCTVGAGQNCELDVRLTPIGTPVRVTSNVDQATLVVDGEERGPVPFEGNLPVGDHRLEVRAPGYRTQSAQVRLVPAAEPRIFDVRLRRENEGPSEEEVERQADEIAHQRFGAASHAAGALPRDQAVLDMSLGWPYVAELRLNVGIFDFLEGGFAIRTLGRLTEFEGRVELGYRPVRQLAVAAQARFGGGLGPANDADANMDGMAESHSTNNWFFMLEALGTLYFSDRGAFTLYMGLDAYTDRWDFRGNDSDIIIGSMPSRQNQTRVRLGGTLEIVLNRRWNVWGQLEGILVGPDDKRRLYGDMFGTGVTDTELYFRLGVTHKF